MKESYNFTWDISKEDDEIYKNGVTVCWIDAKQKTLQKFIEAISYKIGCKVDFSYSAGRAHIDVLPNGVKSLKKALKDKTFMKQFLEYEEDSDNYFHIIG